ncbi:Malate/lactate dehydrogenase-like protein [Alkaliphilus metalliredigens QYMF]|uniref:Malate/lactate dehydrogenase-like protein n=1 Tax=Alkaliphilus metalliredigens (strain QYMF) TaxID=293826 RepID=A6TNS9_ALKMQ|nr:lactate dehydrogenase [Alkaliphilus metalliredigens]ABR47847.1 Malate/lactate dehydrogenase-like protein [Alkaliphilus metalliredigens QYMF]
MFYYRFQDNILFSRNHYPGFEQIDEVEVQKHEGSLYYLKSMDPNKSRRTFSLSHPALIFTDKENLNLIHQEEFTSTDPLPLWIQHKIEAGSVTGVNTDYPDWETVLTQSHPKKWRVHIAGLGDVGGTLLMGLRLLGDQWVDRIGIYDRTPNKLKRWEQEINQIYNINDSLYPDVHILENDQLFNCDMFVFCIAARVPAIGDEAQDVRMVQLEANSEIIEVYAKQARDAGFKGIFAVVSDPVDLLCKVVLNSSNTDNAGNYDFKGLAPEQIRGYGLGVMNARARYYSKENPKALHFEQEGRSFGPHGADLVIADSIYNYNESLSAYLTEKAKKANLEVRQLGFKPYIAPALSSGALSILSTIKGEWHYSATYMGGVYMGAKNRLISSGTEVETLTLHPLLLNRLQETYDKLEAIL